MRTIGKLFGKSPFTPLQNHMKNVKECIDLARELYAMLESGDHGRIIVASKEISKLEYKADLIKNEIRDTLARGFFMPVDRGNLLDILSIQDNLADRAEDIGVLLTFRELTLPDGLRSDFRAFVDKNFEAFDGAYDIIDQLDELMEFSFGGREAVKVNEMIDQVAFREHEADKLQRTLLIKLYHQDPDLHYRDFILLLRLISETSAISNYSEKLAHRVRLMLDLK